MATTYRPAGDEVNELLREVIKNTYQDLREAEVTVSVLLAHSGEEGTPALKHHGYTAAAIVKVNSYQDRVEGKADATIKVDGDRWDDWTEAQQRALLDHELAHLVLQRDAQGGVKTDDAGRPKLATREHDFEMGGFWDVVDRHGKEAFEAQAYRDLHREFSQKTFPWG